MAGVFFDLFRMEGRDGRDKILFGIGFGANKGA